MSKESKRNKQIYRRIWQEIWNAGRLDVVDELFGDAYIGKIPAQPGPVRGKEGFKQLVRSFRTAMPDLSLEVHDMIAEDDRVVAYWTSRGTNTGPFLGLSPTHKAIEVDGMTILRFENGLVVQEWETFETLGFMQQLGLVPMLGAAPAETDSMQSAVTPEHVRAAYDALASADIERIKGFWAEDMVWQVPGHNRLSGWYYGLDGFLSFMGEVGELSDHSFRMDPIAGQVLVTGEYSCDLTRNRGYRAGHPGKTMDIEVAHVLRWKNGKVIAGKGAIFGDGTTEYDQFWSESPAVTPPTHGGSSASNDTENH